MTLDPWAARTLAAQTPDRELNWTEPGFNHGAARDRALTVLGTVLALIPDTTSITSAGIEHSGAVRVQLSYDDAAVLVADCDPATVSYRHTECAAPDGDQHYWSFKVDGVQVEVVGVEPAEVDTSVHTTPTPIPDFSSGGITVAGCTIGDGRKCAHGEYDGDCGVTGCGFATKTPVT